jgi:hypothetical protein
MSTSLPLSILLVAAALAVTPAGAQTRVESNRPIAVQAALGDGRISGVVLDEVGTAVGGVSIFASGATLAVARSDSRGRFQLVLPVGNYLLRASRDGFASTYREPIRVEPNRHLQRRIRLIRATDMGTTPVAAQPPDQPAVQPPQAPPADELHGHGEMAWRLRHLKRSILRDVAPAVLVEPETTTSAPRITFASWVDHAITQTARSANAFFTDTDFTGHINLLATSAIPGLSSGAPADLSRGIASVFIAGPVGQVADWSIRGAMAAGDASSWTLLGEYETRPDQRHAFRFAVSYSTQGFTPAGELSRPLAPDSRSAGGFAASDRWQLRPSVVLDYGVRFDHYDYLSEPSLVGPHAAFGIELMPGTSVRASSSQRMSAPGADEFLPPTDAGPWLPPMRTFQSFVPDAPLRPERIRRHAVGMNQQIGDGAGRLTLEWFNENTRDQMVTMFGIDDETEAAPYYVATLGQVEVTGWRVGIEGALASNVNGRVDYTEGKARWSGTRAATQLRRFNPSVARHGRENVSDLRGRLNVAVPATATHVVVRYQLTRLAPVVARTRMLTDDGFALEVRQRLPYEPLTTGLVHLVFTASTLLQQHDGASLYDEVLTTDAPARLTAGIQVGF